MLDDFREAGDFLEDEEEPETMTTTSNDDLFLGMTPTQRFVLAVLFFLSICMLGSFCLLVTDKIMLPLY
ncbi:MAG: hypothetical protein GXO56_02475 [Chloroflexi bacterium]|nr:hypothetical protein [Chloroflexota bacterium]